MTPALPATMQAAVYRRPREVVVEARPVPSPGPGEVLVQVSYCGICGTDLHLMLEGMGAPESIAGHEWSGRVVSVGQGVSGFAPGDGVIGGPEPGCGACPGCRAGRPSLCSMRTGFDPSVQGAFAEFVCRPAAQLRVVPEGLSLREAALTEPLTVALHALDVARIADGQSALVTGAGPIGLLVIAALRAQGIDDVRASEPAAVRRERAGKVGATRLLEPPALARPPMPFTVVDDPVDVVFECSGHPDAAEAALAQLRPMGTLVLVGTGLRHPRLDRNRILMNELVVTGSYCHGEGGFERALALIASGRLPLRALLEPVEVGLHELVPALERLAAGELAGKVMVAPGPGDRS